MEGQLAAQPGVTLLDLLIQIGVVASIASVLVRSRRFKHLLFKRQGTRGESFMLAAFLSLAFGAGVLLRILLGYRWADATLAGCFLAGLVGGPATGLMVGLAVGLPTLFLEEWLGPVLAIVCGLTGGGIRAATPGREGVWSFSPFTFTTVYRYGAAWLGDRRLDFRFVLVISVISLDLARMRIHQHFPGLLFAYSASSLLLLFCILLKTLMCIGIPIKIWNNTRIEILLEEQEAALLKTRYDALKRQINPHFLFNTLNSIASLIRRNPEKARETVIRLSQILRQLLQQSDYVQLRHELDFIDSYLAIETTRFGKDHLRVIKEVDPSTNQVELPSMILQPIVENALRHGLSSRIGGGAITIRTFRTDRSVCIEIADDGVGFPPGASPGIGLRNVRERLRVCYGDNHDFQIDSAAGTGTRVRLTIPEVPPASVGDGT